MPQSDTALLALDGALNTCQAVLALAEARDVDETVRNGIFGMLAAIGTARALMEPETAPPIPEGECPHDMVVERMAGGETYKVCNRCGKFL